MNPGWVSRALQFINSMSLDADGIYRSVPNGPGTLYGTCYGLLARTYLGENVVVTKAQSNFLINTQEAESGLLVGPELQNFLPKHGSTHDLEHLRFHLVCAALPVIRQFDIQLRYPVNIAHHFCDRGFLRSWLDKRDLHHAWLEGNNFLFIGQLLVYLRDCESCPDAQSALDVWFDWLNTHADPRTSLWGTDGYCSVMEAVYGGYHQLLVYYHEGRDVANTQGLVDAVLSLQHPDGGFNPAGNGGACEDVDSVDILVNTYKQFDYRRPEIRVALRRCMRHILATQNLDGGFPYNRNTPQSHMGIPGTAAPPDVSTMFPTWFRIHTLALMAEILTDESELQFDFRFTENLSMGWHLAWDKGQHQLTAADRKTEMPFELTWLLRYMRYTLRRVRSCILTLIRQAYSRLLN
jgi:hypothetical protein